MYHAPPKPRNPYPGGTFVMTARALRRLGRDIPKGTRGFVLGHGQYYGTHEVRIDVPDIGSFVVSPAEIGRDSNGECIDDRN